MILAPPILVGRAASPGNTVQTTCFCCFLFPDKNICPIVLPFGQAVKAERDPISMFQIGLIFGRITVEYNDMFVLLYYVCSWLA